MDMFPSNLYDFTTLLALLVDVQLGYLSEDDYLCLLGGCPLVVPEA